MSFRQKSEDLFNHSRMSFGEHLEELRKVLVRSLIGVAIACAIGFWFADKVVKVLTGPLENAIEQFDKQDAMDDLVADQGYVPPEYLAVLDEDQIVPRKVFLDVNQFIRAMQEKMPGFAAQVELEPFNFNASHFDREKLPELAGRLVKRDLDATQNARLQAVWELINAENQAELERIAKTSTGSDLQLETVVKIFNQLANERGLKESPAFESELVEGAGAGLRDLFVPDKPKPLAKIKSKLDEEFDVTLNRRLNRALLTQLFAGLMPPLKTDLVPIEIWESSVFEPQSLGVAEPFTVWLKAGILSGLVLAGPWVFFQLWSFVAAGLYPHEKKYIHIFLPISILLFVAGVLLAFFFVFQPVLGFLFSFNRSMGIEPDMRISDWIGFVMFLPLGFGLAFQLPLVMLFMNRIGLFSVSDYLSKWRIAVLVIFVLAMFLTPADPISMLLLAIPLTLLYFLGILMCKWMPSPASPFGDEVAPIQ